MIAPATGYDLYIKHTPKGGASHIRPYRVWNGALFFDDLYKTAKKEGDAVTESSEAEYRAAHWPKK